MATTESSLRERVLRAECLTLRVMNAALLGEVEVFLGRDFQAERRSLTEVAEALGVTQDVLRQRVFTESALADADHPERSHHCCRASNQEGWKELFELFGHRPIRVVVGHSNDAVVEFPVQQTENQELIAEVATG